MKAEMMCCFQHSTGNCANDLVYIVFILNPVPVTVPFGFSGNVVSTESTVVIADSDIVRTDFWGSQVDCKVVV